MGKVLEVFLGVLNIIMGQGKCVPDDITIRRPELYELCVKIYRNDGRDVWEASWSFLGGFEYYMWSGKVCAERYHYSKARIAWALWKKLLY